MQSSGDGNSAPGRSRLLENARTGASMSHFEVHGYGYVLLCVTPLNDAALPAAVCCWFGVCPLIYTYLEGISVT